MEINGLQCNKCGSKCFHTDPEYGLWATILVTVPQIGLEKRVHFCPPCFTLWNKEFEPGPTRLIDHELERALLEGSENPFQNKAVTTGEHPVANSGPENGGKGRRRG